MRRTGFTTVVAPSSVVIDFYLAPADLRCATGTRPDRQPELDKLIRSTLDALTTAGAIEDDARVVDLIARKHDGQSWCGARIAVCPA